MYMESKVRHHRWIFVRAYKREEQLYIEIEDTGSGIEEQKLYQMQHDMQNADIEMLKNKKSVGMLNACLRLKMYTEDHVCFEIEGRRGCGNMDYDLHSDGVFIIC